jgi:hypothetical protein
MRRASHRPCFLLASLAVVAFACDRGSEPSPASTPASASTSVACDAAHAKALEQELLAQCAISEQVLTTDVPAAPWKPAPSAPPQNGALRLELAPTGVAIGWGPPVPLADLLTRLAEQREQALAMASATGRPAPSGWVLAITGATPRADVATVLQALADTEQRRGHLLLATDATGPLPVPRDPKRLAELATRITGADPSTKATLLAEEIERSLPPCPALVQGFSTVATIDPENRCRVLARSISEGLVSCDCPEEDALMTLLYAITVGVEPPTRLAAAVPTMLDPTAPARPGATWAELVATLDEAALARLWVSPG